MSGLDMLAKCYVLEDKTEGYQNCSCLPQLCTVIRAVLTGGRWPFGRFRVSFTFSVHGTLVIMVIVGAKRNNCSNDMSVILHLTF